MKLGRTLLLLDTSGLWSDWTDLGLVCDAQLVQPSDVDRLFVELPKALAALLSTVPRHEREQVAVALNACSSDTINRFRADLWIYMEACLYSANSSRPLLSFPQEEQKPPLPKQEHPTHLRR